MNVLENLGTAGKKIAGLGVGAVKALKESKPCLYEKEGKVILFAMAQGIRLYMRIFPDYRKTVKEIDFSVLLRTRNNSVVRWYKFENGKVRTGTELINADCGIIFWNEEELCRVIFSMLPKGNKLDFVHSTKNMRSEIFGEDKYLSQFFKIAGTLPEQGAKYGTPMPDGTTRYTSNTNGGPMFVYVKDGRIIRMTPIVFDDDDAPVWTIEAHGKKFSPPRKTTVTSYSQCLKSCIYSKDRILYPMIREDFDPKGERNTQNRGKSGYRRISWDEALDIVASELVRVKETYGPGAIMNGSGSHHSWGNIGYWLSNRRRYGNIIGTSWVGHNPDSWEGWFWGAVHHWGHTMRLGNSEAYNTVEDTLKNCELLVFWSSDPEATHGAYGAYDGLIRRLWAKELGIKFVHIDPFHNYTAGVLGGKWFAPKPGTSPAMAHAIAYVWITEDTYDKWFVENRTTGFEEWKKYVLGQTDGIPKTPEWQEDETGIPAKDVRALAREMAKKRTYLGAGGCSGFGSACRYATGVEWARSMVYLLAMMGLGKPGVNIGNMQAGTPLDTRFYFPGYAEGGMSGDIGGTANAVSLYQKMPTVISMSSVKQSVPRLYIPEAIMEKKCLGYPTDSSAIEGQFLPQPYPMPGVPTIKIYHKYGGSHFGTMVDTTRYARMYADKDLEFVMNQSIWLEGEAKYADILLPACTNFERWDIGETASCAGYITHSFLQNNHRTIVLQHKCIEPLGESKSDFEIYRLILERLGLGAYFSEGTSELGWCRRMFYSSDISDRISWSKFLKKGYYVVPPYDEKTRDAVAWNWYYEGRQLDTPELQSLPSDDAQKWRTGIQTQSGKIEFVSSSLMRYDPNDEERPPMSIYKPSWEGPRSELAKKYPYQLFIPHNRYSFHTQQDGKDGWLLDIDDHRIKIDDWHYWIARINKYDAAAKEIKEGDLVELYNDRASVVCVARITARVPKGSVHSYGSSCIYHPLGEPGKSTDIGGCVNNLSPSRPIVKKSHSMCGNSVLIEFRKWKGGK
jgi:trimethylamine-N-oxide reductase (cytochrome c)